MGKAKKTTNIYMAILTASLPEKLKTFLKVALDFNLMTMKVIMKLLSRERERLQCKLKGIVIRNRKIWNVV